MKNSYNPKKIDYKNLFPLINKNLKMSNTICQIDIYSCKIIAEFKNLDEIVKLYSDKNPRTVKNAINTCLRGDQKITYEYHWTHKSKINDTPLNEYLIGIRPDNLLVDLYPNLVKIWDSQKNIDIDIEKITSGSRDKVYWKCVENESHESYLMDIYNQIHKQGENKCIRCRKVLIKNYYENNKTKKMETGYKNELYVFNLLKSTGLYDNIILIGNTGDYTDIVITTEEGIQKSLQVKTLTRSHQGIDNYYTLSDWNYDHNMLIAMVSNDHTHFALEFAGNINVKTIGFSFANKNAKYKDIMHTDEKTFLENLIELIPSSCDYKEFSSAPSIINEYYSFKRLEQWCINNGLTYRRNEMNHNTIDFYINDIPIQGKYRAKNCIDSMTYGIDFTKSAGSVEGKEISEPYSEKDPFQLIIIEIGGTNDDLTKYQGLFCIIPKKSLIEEEMLSSETCRGKTKIYICPPDYQKDHWSKQFWVSQILTAQQKLELFNICNKPKLKILN